LFVVRLARGNTGDTGFADESAMRLIIGNDAINQLGMFENGHTFQKNNTSVA
jgi:hypothetical protein